MAFLENGLLGTSLNKAFWFSAFFVPNHFTKPLKNKIKMAAWSALATTGS